MNDSDRATLTLGGAVRRYHDAHAEERRAETSTVQHARDAAILDTFGGCLEACMLLLLGEMWPGPSDTDTLMIFDSSVAKYREHLVKDLTSLRRTIAENRPSRR